MRSVPSFRFAASLLAILVQFHPVFGGAAAQSELSQPASGRTLVVAIEVDRDGARLIGFTVKDRPFVARDESSRKSAGAEGKTRIEVALLGPGGARMTQNVAVGGLCLAHDPDAPAEVVGDTIRLHRESVLVEIPEIEGFDRLELAYETGPAAARVRAVVGPLKLDAAHYTRAGGRVGYETLAIAKSPFTPAAPLTPGTLHFPEEYNDPDIFAVYGDGAEISKRINVVIVPDGYTYSQKATMQAHAQALVAAFRAKTPFMEHDRFLNYILVYAYSSDDGTDQCDCGIVRDTAMSTRFFQSTPICGSMNNRCLYYGNGCDTDTSSHIAATELRAPAGDQTIVMVNTSRYGGCGGQRAVYAAGDVSATEIALHELGHSMAGLQDEYGGMAGCGNGGGINTSMDPNNGNWPEWISEIGAPWEGAQYYNHCIYRPIEQCAMRSFGEFCPVCRQQWALTIFGHSRVSPGAPISASSPGSPVDTDRATPQVFSVATRLASGPGVTNDITWQLQGPGFPNPTTVATGTDSHTRTFTEDGTYTLTSRVVADTNFIKPPKNGANVDLSSWTVRVCNRGATLASNNGPVCDGGTLQLSAGSFTGATYSWTGPGGFLSSAQNPAIPNATASSAGTYTVTITATGCNFTSPTTATIIANGSSCDDHDACTQVQACQGGVCVGGSPANCDDGNLCTADGCAPASGCTHTATMTCPGGGDACHPAGVCNPSTGQCAYPSTDVDGDGHSGATCGGDDCNDSNSGVWLAPIEVSQLRVAGKSPTTISWDDQRGAVGTSTQYNLVSGSLQLGGLNPYETSICLSGTTTGASFVDVRANPPAGVAYWYMSRARNSCGTGTYGSAAANGLMNPCP